jgi:hypothetical protein
MNEKYWGYLIHLSDNMWGDPWSRIRWAHYFPELNLDEDVWKNTIDFLPAQGINMVLIDVGDAVQYERHPELSIKGARSKDKLKKELVRIRSLGMTPFPKLNFSAGHDAWLGDYSRMLSTPKYYEVCKDCIEEVAELFEYPKYFHLGMDEEDAEMQGAQGFICVRQMELYWHDIYKLFDYVETTGCTPWVWTSPRLSEKDLAVYLQRMPKSVLQSNYWYNRFKKLHDGKYTMPHCNLYRTLDELGYQQILCSSCVEGYSMSYYETMEMAKNELNDNNILGFMTAPWRNCHFGDRYALMDDAFRFGLAKKEWYPEGK